MLLGLTRYFSMTWVFIQMLKRYVQNKFTVGCILYLQITDYYTEKGVVDTTRFSLPGFQPNLPLLNSMFLDNRKTMKRENELIPINDCFYRNMYR